MLGAWRRQAVILVYHRIAEVEVDPWELAVRPANFAQHLDVMRRLGSPISLRGLVQSMMRGAIPRGSIVVTFDDGYADNLLQAKPLLAKSGIPATVFLTAGKLGASESFWWEELADILLRPGCLPDVLEIEMEGRPCRWKLGADADYDLDDASRNRGWRGWKPAPTARHRTYLELFRLMQPLREAARGHLMVALRSWSARGPGSRPEDRVLTAHEAVALASDGIEAGCHTMTHPRLSTLSDAEKRREVLESRNLLQEILGQPVTSFAYPFGQRGDYDAETVAIVREAGFGVACANVPGCVTSASDVFQLPRFHVTDGDGDAFARAWTGWQRN